MRWQDNLIMAVILFIALGVWSLFSVGGLPSLGAILSFTTFFVLCYLCCFLPRKWKTKKLDKYKAALSPEESVRSLEEFKYCIRCGAKMKRDVKICTNCGQPFEI